MAKACWKRRASIFLLIVFFLLRVGSLGADSAGELVFDWAFVKRGLDGEAGSIDFSRRVRISSNDLFKIYIQPLRGAYIYLYLYDVQKELYLLFPERFEDFDDRDYLGQKYYLPDGDAWFSLDDSRGVEKFYLLASVERLTRLEALTEEYTLLYDNRKGSSGETNTARQRVLDEIVSIRKQHSQFVITAEKPVPIAGGVRGQNADLEKLATRINAEGFYTKTLRLEHKD